MKILQLISSAGYYGAESMMTSLAKSLNQRGHHVTIGLIDNTHRPGNDMAEIAAAQGLSVKNIVCEGRMNWDAVRAVAACIQQNDFDVVHTHGYKADTYALAAMRKVRTPLLSTCHNWTIHTPSLGMYSLLDVICLRYFDMAVAVSVDVAAILRRFGIPKRKITTISNGVDLSAFHNARPTLARQFRKRNGLIVGMVGRLEPDKGQEYLLRAAPEILAAFPDTMFLFAGEGPSRPALEKLVEELQIRDNVLFLGKRRDIAEIYASMDIFALPSLNEGMPMVILEALAAGKPVVATPVGDIPKLICHEDTGLLVKPKDVAGLRGEIRRLIVHPELRAQLGERGRARVDLNFSSEAMAREYESVYERIYTQRTAAQPTYSIHS